MTQPSGADDPVDPLGAAARAETYLRLLAEEELRRALARRRSRTERIPPTAVLWAANAVGAVTGTADLAARSLVPGVARAGQAAMRFLAPPALAPRARQAAEAVAPRVQQAAAVLAPPARRAGRAVRQAGWRARMAADQLGERLTGHGEGDEPGPEDGLDRLNAVADVLVAAGVLARPTAQEVTHVFGRALAVRGLVWDYYALPEEMIEHEPPDVAPAGPIAAVGIGAPVDLAADGYRARMHVLGLVLAPDVALLTTASWLVESPPGRPTEDDDDPEGPWDDEHLSDLVQAMNARATDNRGGTYRLEMDSGGGDSDGPWEAQLRFAPVPPAGLDWLDLTMGRGQDPVRVDLTGASRQDRPAATGPPASPAQRAERILDSVSVRLLGQLDHDGGDPDCEDGLELGDVAGLVRALRAVDALAPDSPALARLVTLIRRLALPVPGELAAADAAGPAELPGAWLAALRRERGVSPQDHAAAATAVAVLPELDGARCVINGLQADPDSGIALHVLAWGWGWSGGRFDAQWRPYTWSARDDTGRWYLGHEEGFGSSDGVAELQVALSPPLHPEATSLEVTLAGLSGQVTATVPVTWARTP